MKTTCRAALVVAALGLLIPLSARSEIRAGSIEVSPFVGYNFFENDQNLKDRYEFGGRLGYNFTKHIGIEGSIEFIPGRVKDRSIMTRQEGRYGGQYDHVDLKFYHLDAVWHFMPEGRFNPFVVAGIGGSTSSPAVSDQDMAAINVGVGAKFWVTDRVAIRGDFRDYIVTEVFQETFHNLGATLGVTFAFGGRDPVEPAPAAKVAPPPPPRPEPVVVAKVEPPPPPPPPPPSVPSVSFSASPATIQKGQCSNLSWNSSYASSVSIDQGVGSVPASGSKQVCPASATSYTLTGSGPGGTRSTSTTISVTEPPPPPKPVPAKVVIRVAEPKAEEKVKVAVVEPKVVILAFEDVHFDFDKSSLKPEAQELLKRNIQILKDNPNAKIRVAGYTSASGTDDYNQKLSERRAEAVKAYLVSEGVITSERLSTIGYGKTDPAEYEAAPNDLYSDEAKANMRVLFEIVVQ